MATANAISQESNLVSQGANLDGHHEASFDGTGELIEQTTSVPNDAPVVPEINDDPLKVRISNPSRGWKKWIKIILEWINPPLTAAERAQLDEVKALKLKNKLLREEAFVAADRISNALDRLGFSYVSKGANGEIKKLVKVRFDMAESSEDAHWLHVSNDLPRGVSYAQLVRQDVVDDLGKSVGHKVNVRATDEAGVWYIIERASGMMGIPTHVQIKDMWQGFPESASKLSIPLGMTNNRKKVYRDLDDMVHILVAGQTGGGKSNALAVIITTLITRNTPDELKLVLLDMKAGLEFQFYEGLPHLLAIPDAGDGIVEDPDKVYPTFRWLLNVEAKRRMNTIRNSNHRSIEDYNQRRKSGRLPRILVICDEWGIARLSEHGKDAETELAKSVMLLRAVGIHIIVCTQTPTKEVIGMLVKSNLPTRIALGCSDISASVMICGDMSAVGMPVGRCVLMPGHQYVQIPYVSTEQIKETVQLVKEGKAIQAGGKTHDVTVNELLAYGLHNLQGSLRYQDLYKVFDTRGITRDEIAKILKDLDGEDVTVDGKLYHVEPGAGQRPRRLVAIQE